MLTLQEMIELSLKLARDQISVSLAKDLYWKNLKAQSRSWHTKDWKERRENFLKDRCQICNSKETLTIQHLSHPKKYNYYENEITRKYANELGNLNSIIDQGEFIDHINKNYDYFPIPLCPKCRSRNPNKRMTKLPVYLCTKCHSEFDEPAFKSINEIIEMFYENVNSIEIKDKCFVSNDKWNNHHNLKQIKYWFLRNQTKKDNSEEIEREAFLLYLDVNIKYLSFVDAITACKKCASNYDLNNLELCPKCRKFYKGIQYPTCIQCLPEDKRMNALEMVEIGKQMYETHKRLGID